MRVRPTDFAALVFLTLGITGGAVSRGIDDPATAVVFALAWLSAAIIRLRDFRRGRRPAVKIDQLSLRSGAILLLGAAPWLLLPFLRRVYPGATFWTPVEFGLPVEVLGAAIGIFVIAAPLMTRDGCWRAASSAIDFPLPAIIVRSAALLFITGSPVFAAMSALWITAAVWLAPANVTEAVATPPGAPQPA